MVASIRTDFPVIGTIRNVSLIALQKYRVRHLALGTTVVGVRKKEKHVTECADDEDIYAYIVQIRHGTISEDRAMSVLNELTDVTNVHDPVIVSRR